MPAVRISSTNHRPLRSAWRRRVDTRSPAHSKLGLAAAYGSRTYYCVLSTAESQIAVSGASEDTYIRETAHRPYAQSLDETARRDVLERFGRGRHVDRILEVAGSALLARRAEALEARGVQP